MQKVGFNINNGQASLDACLLPRITAAQGETTQELQIKLVRYGNAGIALQTA